ncbi:MAG: DUF433 domain-containing protein [Balneolaceae bacterium]|nr:MAG: DUF433 domain-containing protein [Balneolaceae bacterium]
MGTAFTQQPTLGEGIFTPSEIAKFLKLPTGKVNRWVNSYWDGDFASKTGHGYSWKKNDSKAVNFLTMVELLIMASLSEQGARTTEIVKAHKVLADRYNVVYPFAMNKVISNIYTDGKKVYLDDGGYIINLDGTDQINLEFVKQLFNNLDFGIDDLASRYWPMGKDNSVVVDPERKFGHPVINETNIYPETIYGMVQAGDPPAFIASLYNLTGKEVEDAIAYCSAA